MATTKRSNVKYAERLTSKMRTSTGVVEPILQTGAVKCTGAAEKHSKRLQVVK